MNILITGITGMIGVSLTKILLEKGHKVYGTTRKVLSYSTEHPLKKAKLIQWDPFDEKSIIPEEFKEIDILINLLGENIGDKRWTAPQKKKIIESRVIPTNLLADFFKGHPLKICLSASAIGLYPKNQGIPLDENSPPANDFLGNVCQKWELAASEIPANKTVFLRLGVVLSHQGGMLKKILPLFKLGLGGNISNGKMDFSWIHLNDAIEAIIFCMENQHLNGPVNLVAPNPILNSEFTNMLAKSLKRPAILPVPRFLLKTFLGEMSTLALDGQKIYPKKLLDQNFKFKYPSLQMALNDLLS